MPIKPDIVLDLKGLYCPMHIMKTKKAIDLMRTGQIIEVISNDKGSKLDISALCRRLGLELISVKEENGIFRFTIKK
ncbi:response regulator SirA [Dissulfurispira thermophila]|uniref:Response regulator SirA n=2 Tax=root TaxID=1 RepID=A0A7G1H129_9BACT|nr:sulfurtransferase TusA family protein [Dissulfurispira thermophila]BCB95979.1 response regulator SirA [Dissulfurispira thermophila]